MRVRPLISEVRPLMGQNHNGSLGRMASWSQDQTQNQTSLQEQTSSFQDQASSLWDQSQPRAHKDEQGWTQDQTQLCQNQNQPQQGPDLAQSQTSKVEEVPPEKSSLDLQAHHSSPLKKKFQVAVESKSNLGPISQSATSHLNSSSGLRKAQSVHNLLRDTGEGKSLIVTVSTLTCTLYSD